MWRAAATLQIRSCCSCIEKIRSRQCDAWLTWVEDMFSLTRWTHYMPMISDGCGVQVYMFARCAMTWSEQNQIIKKCTMSCLWKASVRSHENSILSNSQKSNSLQDFGAHSRPQPVCRKAFRLCMQQNYWCSMYHTDPASDPFNIDSEVKSFRTCLIAFAIRGTGPRGLFLWETTVWYSGFAKFEAVPDIARPKKQQKTSCKDWQIHDSIPSNSWWTGAPWFVLLLLVVLAWRKGDTSS